MATLAQINQVLADILSINTDSFSDETSLLGSLPELDSMAVMMLILALENQFQIVFDNDEVEAENFESVGKLLKLINDKQCYFC
ncbi:acyl carrier protein [Aliikangiella maris]|uniref:Acyl carrier protein n=2 Tax=Aliikangiella maris TaxID=3162458 RepID=A0ABV2BWM0_9GAMM